MNMSVTSLSKRLIPLGAAVALACGASAQASELLLNAELTGAGTINLISLTFTSVSVPDTLYFGNDKDPSGLAALVPAAFPSPWPPVLSSAYNFSDLYLFSVSQSVANGQAGVINLTGHQTSLFHARVIDLSNFTSVESVDIDLGGGLGFVSTFEDFSLKGGSYALQILGNAVGASSSSYAGTLNFDVAPVPIPGAVWLLGSALTGVVVTRRRKASV